MKHIAMHKCEFTLHTLASFSGCRRNRPGNFKLYGNIKAITSCIQAVNIGVVSTILFFSSCWESNVSCSWQQLFAVGFTTHVKQNWFKQKQLQKNIYISVILR